MNIFDTLPFRAIRGTWMGLEDGLRGGVDTNEKFSDGARENDPSKKSTAGAFLSDRAGVMGGSDTGRKVGKWVGALGGMAIMGKIVLGAMAAGGLVGAWPIFAAVMLTAGAGFVGAGVGGLVGKYTGGFFGAVAGVIAGPFVGLYNGVFRRGPYEKVKERKQDILPPDMPPVEQPAPQAAPQPPAAPSPGRGANFTRALQQAETVMHNSAVARDMLGSARQGAALPAETRGMAERVQSAATDRGFSRG